MKFGGENKELPQCPSDVLRAMEAAGARFWVEGDADGGLLVWCVSPDVPRHLIRKAKKHRHAIARAVFLRQLLAGWEPKPDERRN